MDSKYSDVEEPPPERGKSGPSLDYILAAGGGMHGWGPAQHYPANTDVFRQGSPANAIYLIERGLLKLTWVGCEGQELILGLRRRPWLTGTPAVLLERNYAYTGTTLLPCTLRCISAEAFRQMVAENAEFSRQLLRLLSERILSDGLKIAALACLPAAERLQEFLCELTLEQEHATDLTNAASPMRLHIPLKLKELAHLIAITPEYLSRLLKALERTGAIKRDRGWLILTDPSKLRSGEN